MLNKFIYIDSKEEFLNLLNQGEVLDEAIVFIEDTREIWNHGTYFDGKSIDDCVSNQQFNELLSASNYEFVDLGLPSGLKWATCNIGANSPEEGGLYFAWGETEGHTKDTERIFNTDSYKHYKDGEYTKYTIYTFEKRDDLTTLEPCDDAAYVLDTCRMPTKDDFEELVNNTDFKHIQVKGINVLKCTSRVNDNYILIPLAGSYCLNGSKLLFSGEMAMLWSSSLDCSYSLSLSSAGAYILRIDLTQPNPYVDTTYRDFGVNIRPVLDSTFSSKTNFKDVFLKIFNLKEELKATKTEIPTKLSQLENNSNYITKSEVFNKYLVKGNYALESDVEIENGVYAVDANGELIDYNTADSSALGVALVVGEHKFMIAKSDATNDGSNRYLYWTKSTSDLLLLTNNTNVDGTNSEGYLPKPDGTFAGSTKAHLSGDFTTWTTGALSDFNGKDNTTVIAASSSDVKDICTVLNTFNTTTDSNNIGKNDWYVPACGQLALMWLNKKEINEAFAKIGGNALADEYWSSSEKSANLAWIVDLYNGYIYLGYKSNDSKVRFVRNFPVKTLNERITNLETSKQDVISDLEEIRSGSALGATALQALDLNNYALSVNGLINNINSNINGVSSEVANVKRIAEAALTKATNNESAISQCATKNELNTAIADLVDSAPETLNTLNELATAISEHKDVTDALDAAIANKANKTELPTKVSQLENDTNYITTYDLNVKQDTLISGTNIKTINGTSILGSGNIVISGGGSSSGSSGAYAEVSHGTGDTTFALTPNTFHVWDEVASLDLSFADETAGVANEYLFQFTSGATATTLTLPDGLKWANDRVPAILENMIYQISILKGMASILEFSNNSESQLITFFYSGVAYQAEEGMTWEEWCDSEYNSTTLKISDGRLTVNGVYPVTNSYGILVYGSDMITPYESYEMPNSGGGN